MHVSMFTSWQVRCGIADYAAHLVASLRELDDTSLTVVAFDRETHPRADYARWGEQMNAGEVAHIQHEYAFFGYLLPWRNHFGAFASRIRKPIVITKHVSFDGPLNIVEPGLAGIVRQFKWSLYNRWLGPYARTLNKDTFDLARQIIVLSARLEDQLIARGIDAAKVHVIPPGVPDLPPAAGGDRLRAEWGWQGRRIVCQFGFVTPAKGHLIAVDALARLPEDYVLLIAGGLRRESDISALNAIRRRVAERGLSSRVRITGYLSEADVSPHLSAADVLIYPYTHVDSSYSLIAGLAHRTAPIVASDVFAHRELADRCPGVTLFPSSDAAALARRIHEVTHEADRREALLRAAARFARENAWPVMARRTREVYERALRP